MKQEARDLFFRYAPAYRHAKGFKEEVEVAQAGIAAIVALIERREAAAVKAALQNLTVRTFFDPTDSTKFSITVTNTED